MFNKEWNDKVIATQGTMPRRGKAGIIITQNSKLRTYSLCGNVTQLFPSRAINASASSGPQLSGA